MQSQWKIGGYGHETEKTAWGYFRGPAGTRTAGFSRRCAAAAESISGGNETATVGQRVDQGETGGRTGEKIAVSWIPRKLRREVYDRAGGKCQHCLVDFETLASMHPAWRKYLPKGAVFEIDHIVPRSQGGTDDIDNLQVLCATCHRAKSEDEDYPISIHESTLTGGRQVIRYLSGARPREQWSKENRMRAKYPWVK